jgi:phage terminase large subunit-like protein
MADHGVALNWVLLAWQIEVWKHPARFKVIAAGRRTGKSNYVIKKVLKKALEAPEGSAVAYIAPTLAQARQICWDAMLEQGKGVVKSAHVNNMDIVLTTGRKIHVRSAENPDTMRGLKLFYAAIDEGAFIANLKALWEKVLRPALADLEGEADFISSPDGRNDFYELYQYALTSGDPEWAAFHYTTRDNPTIPVKEIEAAKKSLSTLVFKQEFEASFATAGQEVFKEEWIITGKEPQYGSYVVAVDLAGFEDLAKGQTNKKKLDETAIAIVKISDEDGTWWVRDIVHGRWDIKETASKILSVISEYQPIAIGIEKGALKNAVLPYLTDLMRKYNKYSHIHDLTHGNRKKTDRIVWSLQGRFEHGRIVLNEDANFEEFREQLCLFPTAGVHDDLVDALSYVDQIAVTSYNADYEQDDYEVLDPIAGY